MAMRPKTPTDTPLPPKMLKRVRRSADGTTEWVSYFYNGRDPSTGKRREYPLGTDLNEAKRKWAEHECRPAPAETGLMRHVFDRYEKEIIPKKAPATQRKNAGELRFLRSVFDSAPVNAITPQHVAQYLDKRSAKTCGNREIALLSHAFNKARAWGYTTNENPVKGVEKNKETPRNYYAENDVWDAVYAHAVPELRDIMDMAYLTGQRPADVLKMRAADIKGGAIEVKQNKTHQKTLKILRIMLDDEGRRTELGQVIDRFRKRKVQSLYLISMPDGSQMTRYMLRDRFDAARLRAAAATTDAELAVRIKQFQFRDIRPKAATDINEERGTTDASKLLGHSKEAITKMVYIRKGENVKPTR